MRPNSRKAAGLTAPAAYNGARVTRLRRFTCTSAPCAAYLVTERPPLRAPCRRSHSARRATRREPHAPWLGAGARARTCRPTVELPRIRRAGELTEALSDPSLSISVALRPDFFPLPSSPVYPPLSMPTISEVTVIGAGHGRLRPALPGPPASDGPPGRRAHRACRSAVVRRQARLGAAPGLVAVRTPHPSKGPADTHRWNKPVGQDTVRVRDHRDRPASPSRHP